MSSVEAVRELLASADPHRPVVMLTGAGVSAESGIPTFRGPEGYWTVGSEVYHPQQMATQAAFRRMPREVWRWYLYRWSVCRAAAPNPGHFALAELERGLGERFWLITQNVDGLHLRAGNSAERTLEIHGNIDYMRPAWGGAERIPLPEGLPAMGKDDPLTDAVWDQLVFPDGRRARPNVLWFDEYYDEKIYRAQTAERAARTASVLVTVGTTGSTTLPVRCLDLAYKAGATLIDINPADNEFRQFVDRAPRGLSLHGPAGRWLPVVVEELLR
ncbi:MAG: RNA polymerase subunit sigma [Alphaproteobacteria bacterium]|nr:RNA polymerase subunit sigma [Alphaproteobacteria bacterium]MCB9796844.1 RNA polymerase subunit sigma [Alphaproteobacteria bacterium]